MNCSEHKKEVAGISDMKVLAEMIGDLHYETLAELLTEINHKLQKDSIEDSSSGRNKLAMCLWEACCEIGSASNAIYEAWQISKPFMKSENPK